MLSMKGAIKGLILEKRLSAWDQVKISQVEITCKFFKLTEEFMLSAIDNRRLYRSIINVFVQEKNDGSLDELETQGGCCYNLSVRG